MCSLWGRVMGWMLLHITKGASTQSESNLFFNTHVFKVVSLTNHTSNGWPCFILFFSLSSGGISQGPRWMVRKWKTSLDIRTSYSISLKTGNGLSQTVHHIENRYSLIIIEATIIRLSWACIMRNIWPGSKNLVLCATVIPFNNQTICIMGIQR